MQDIYSEQSFDPEDALTPERLIAKYHSPNHDLEATLLPGLDTVDWADLEHAHGAATDVPALLRAILSHNDNDRDFAFQLLFETVWHQGTVYSASAYTVPFLIQLLTQDATLDKASVLHLLSCLAEGHSYLAVHERTEQQIAEARIWLAKSGIDFDTQLQHELAWVRASHQAVVAGVPTFLQLLNQPDPDIYVSALYVLSKLPDAAAAILPHLEASFAARTDRAQKGHALLALDALVPTTPMGACFFERILQSEHDEVLRAVAAIAVLKRQGRGTAADIISMLIPISTLLDTDPSHRYETWSLDARFYPGPWGNDRAVDIAHAFAALGLPEGAQVLMTALAGMTNSNVTHIFVEHLLDLVFSGKQIDALAAFSRTTEGQRRTQYFIRQEIMPRHQDMLDSLQRTALVTVARNTPYWEIDSNLLELYGIPSTRNALQEWLSNN